MSRHIYTLKKPAGWHKELWREALPLGNGLTGFQQSTLHFARLHELI